MKNIIRQAVAVIGLSLATTLPAQPQQADNAESQSDHCQESPMEQRQVCQKK